jgi:D-alanyl-D-alanine carboxypeptidase (penicillin-binding protein 5/6)
LGGSQLGKRGVVADLSAGAAKLPQVKARTWLLADATTGEVLAAKNPHKARRPASTLKTLTALTLLPQLEPDATWIGTARAQNTYGSKAGIRKGREYTIDELFAGLLLPSGNDAAIALAQAHSTVSATVAEMNQVARELQAYNTTAKNPSGLDAKGQFSTAYDLALIGRAAITRDDFLTYAGAKSAEFPNPRKPKKNGKERKPITIYNQNDLVMENYRGAIGVKTGYTSQAGRTFIGAAQRGNTTLIVSLMGIREPSDEAARKLLNWGFQNRGQIVPIGELVPPLSAVAPTVAEETVVPTAPTPVATTVRGSAPQQIVAEPELSSLSPTSWGWLTVFTIALVLALVSLIRRIVTRKQRRALT